MRSGELIVGKRVDYTLGRARAGSLRSVNDTECCIHRLFGGVIRFAAKSNRGDIHAFAPLHARTLAAMSVFDDIRDPGTTLGKVTYGLGALLLFALLALLAISGSIVYRALNPPRTEPVDIATLMGNPEAVPFQVAGKRLEGWLFPGLRGGFSAR